MHIEFVEIQNFRKLKSIRIDFAPKTTLFVGANNSGKTSAMVALSYFLIHRNSFTTNDFTVSNWGHINKIGSEWEALAGQPGSGFPQLADWETALPSLDLWINVAPDEIHYINQLLPTLDWEGGLLGVRLRFEPKSVDDLFKEYVSAIRAAKATIKAAQSANDPKETLVKLWPMTLCDFLDRRLRATFSIRAYSLDPTKQKKPERGIAVPQPLPAGAIAVDDDSLKALIQIDDVPAQRDFVDANSNGDRNERGERRPGRRLSEQLRSYYNAHLDPMESPKPADVAAIRAIQEAEKVFDVSLRSGFLPALTEVEGLGYPGVTDPRLTIATRLRLTDGLDHSAAVQYDVLPDDGTGDARPLRLPEEYNGLGYQNLISMVFKLMSFRDRWMRVGKAAQTVLADERQPTSPPPLHLVLIEEPEAHLHAQVQQVFIRKAYDLLRNHSDLGANPRLTTQLVVSTHSTHVAHECEFSWLRYFRRLPALKAGDVPITSVVNMSEVFGEITATERFVTRYLKATHCDLFFADAAILVEGPAERILVPQFLLNAFPRVRQSYVTVLEIGGSHAHRLRSLIEHLGLNTLVITDLDAMSPDGKAVQPARNKGLVTRNATLKYWIPRKNLLDDLLDAGDDQKVKTYDNLFSVRVAYQSPLQVQLADTPPPNEVLPNTLEDALVYGNMHVFKGMADEDNSDLKKIALALGKGKTPEALGKGMFEILKTSKKAEMALDLLALKAHPWPIEPPTYIREGLSWLQEQLERKHQEATLPTGTRAAKTPVTT